MENKFKEILANLDILHDTIKAQWPPLAVTIIEGLKACVLSEESKRESLIAAEREKYEDNILELTTSYEKQLQELRKEICDLKSKLNKLNTNYRPCECCALAADVKRSAVLAHSAPVQQFLVQKNPLLELGDPSEKSIRETDSNIGEQAGSQTVSPSKRPNNWDRYEAAFLLKYCLKVEAGEMSRAEAIAIVSKRLRQRAVAKGIIIDDVFRNINGISMQMSSMRNCYLGKKYSFTTSKMFKDIVNLYKNERDSFDKILIEDNNCFSYDIVNNYMKNDSQTDITETQYQYRDSIKKIISEHYKYGFRLGSPIELKRFRNFAEKQNIILPEADKQLDDEIVSSGININDKVYVISEEVLSELASMVDDIFNTGAIVIFLNRLFEVNEDLLIEKHIVSIDMLKEILKKVRSKYTYRQNIITSGERMTEHDAVVNEIFRVSNGNSIVYTKKLSKLLPYIPVEKIALILSRSSEFVWVSEGKYFIMKYFVFTNEDKIKILDYVERECESNGFASITNLPLGDIPEENYELSETAVNSAVYNAILKNNYYLHGKILTNDESGLDFLTLLKNYCQGREYCTESELIARAQELTGDQNKQKVMAVLYDSMIRIGEDDFVAEKEINFDIDKIDTIVSSFVGGRFAAIKSVNTFALFPSCGVPWNYFVLESYCYRFSKQFRLSVNNFNDKNAGLIVSKSLSMSYWNMLSEVAAKSDLELTQEAVCQYFFDNGYTAKRKYEHMPEILELAKKMREEV